jgi:hypothetical protein
MRARQFASSPPLSPGEYAATSGIYQVIHKRHRADHLVTIVKGDQLPSCRRCKGAVRFVLWMQAGYAMQDWDLSGPELFLVPSSSKPAPSNKS